MARCRPRVRHPMSRRMVLGGILILAIPAVPGLRIGNAGAAVGFTEIGAPLTGVTNAAVAWGDDDGDGDLDLLVAGQSSTGPATRLYRNTAGIFAEVATGLPDLTFASMAWGDYDNDGDIDLLLMGSNASGRVTGVWRNDGGAIFTEVPTALPDLDDGDCAWGDVDNDGDLDIALTGHDVVSGVTKLFRNQGGGSFIDMNAGFTGVFSSTIAFGDIDKDGDLDLLFAGYDGSQPITRIYRNTGGSFGSPNASIVGVYSSSAVFGDYDKDGDLDLALAGFDNTLQRTTRIYRNGGTGTFSLLSVTLVAVSEAALAWGDDDSDGDLDLLITGYDGAAPVSRVYQSTSATTFADGGFTLLPVRHGAGAWGDYDSDGDPDLTIVGDNAGTSFARIYRSDGGPANAPPAAPVAGSVDRLGSTLTFNWTAGVDDHTPAAAQTWQLRVGTTPGGSEITSAMAVGNGSRRVARAGIVQGRTSWKLSGLPIQPYYWSVQAIDGAFRGSPFSAEKLLDFPYANSGVTFPAALAAGTACGDPDGDGDLDFILAGLDGATPRTSFLRNFGGNSFAYISVGWPNLQYAAADWGDYDGDGDVDLALAGHNGSVNLTRIYRNDGRFDEEDIWVDIGAGLPGINDATVLWGDVDNDGDLDLLLNGIGDVTALAGVWRNDDGTFTDIGAGLAGRAQGKAAWADDDGDGDLDVAIAGFDENGVRDTRLYQNDGTGHFVDSGVLLIAVADASVSWADYDVDGSPDLLVIGQGPTRVATLYHNDGQGGFTPVTSGLEGLQYAAAAWGDYDADGDPDVVTAGFNGSVNVARLFRNDGGGVFAQSGNFTGVSRASVSFGDCDDDGDLDILIAGFPGPARYYVNQWLVPNGTPQAPVPLSPVRVGDDVTFRWMPGSDDHTRNGGLTYNLRVGTTPGGNDIVPGMSDVPTGRRRIAENGNAGIGTEWTVHLPVGSYWWSVQAVDGAFLGSPYTEEQAIEATSGTPDGLEAPAVTRLDRATPSPFAGSTTVGFSVAIGTTVRLGVFDPSGRLVRRLIEGVRPAGIHEVGWDGRNDAGQPVPAGLYFLRFEAAGTRQVMKVVRVGG